MRKKHFQNKTTNSVFFQPHFANLTQIFHLLIFMDCPNFQFQIQSAVDNNTLFTIIFKDVCRLRPDIYNLGDYKQVYTNKLSAGL